MSTPPAGSAWQVMATLELDDSAESMQELRRITPTCVQLRQSEESPSGYRWVELLIEDNSAGEFQSRTAADILGALELASRSFPAFRIVFGAQWLRHALANAATS